MSDGCRMRRIGGSAPRRRTGYGMRRVQHAHPEASRASRDGLADLAPADHAERRAPDIAAEQQAGRPHPPAARPHEAIALRHAPGRREHQRERQVRRRLGQHARRVADRDAGARRRGEVDVIDPDGQVADRGSRGAAAIAAASSRSLIMLRMASQSRKCSRSSS